MKTKTALFLLLSLLFTAVACGDPSKPTKPNNHTGTPGGACGSQTCQATEKCVNDQCVDKCTGVICTNGETCQLGLCVDLCQGVVCTDPTQRCEGGQCVDFCDETKCQAPRMCKEGHCVDPCEGVTCSKIQECQKGKCVDLMATKCAAYGPSGALTFTDGVRELSQTAQDATDLGLEKKESVVSCAAEGKRSVYRRVFHFTLKEYMSIEIEFPEATAGDIYFSIASKCDDPTPYQTCRVTKIDEVGFPPGDYYLIVESQEKNWNAKITTKTLEVNDVLSCEVSPSPVCEGTKISQCLLYLPGGKTVWETQELMHECGTPCTQSHDIEYPSSCSGDVCEAPVVIDGSVSKSYTYIGNEVSFQSDLRFDDGGSCNTGHDFPNPYNDILDFVFRIDKLAVGTTVLVETKQPYTVKPSESDAGSNKIYFANATADCTQEIQCLNKFYDGASPTGEMKFVATKENQSIFLFILRQSGESEEFSYKVTVTPP